jgi:hypothetical protein
MSGTKNLFLITSVIVPTHIPLCYVNTRSLYTPEQRFEQTKNTIRTIRNKVKNVFIYLIEGSLLPNEMESEIIGLVDRYTNFSGDSEMRKIIDDPQKSKGEVALLLSAIKKFDDIGQFDNIFKISGRYFLNDNFFIERFDNDMNIFRVYPDRYATYLYKIHKSHFTDYVEALNKSLKYIAEGIEVALFTVYPPKDKVNVNIPQIGISGHVAVYKDYFIYD